MLFTPPVGAGLRLINGRAGLNSNDELVDSFSRDSGESIVEDDACGTEREANGLRHDDEKARGGEV